jgi:uncharacterized membrane protein YfhO
MKMLATAVKATTLTYRLLNTTVLLASLLFSVYKITKSTKEKKW